jgi:hypothetical protein
VSSSLAAEKLRLLEELRGLRAEADRMSEGLVRYNDDPLGFIDAYVDFGGVSEGLTDYQREIIAALPVKNRVSVRGPHGLGKTAVSSLVVLWFALTREAAGRDWKCVTTAGGWRQLEHYLWPEIRKWAHRLRWDDMGRRPLDERGELLALKLRMRSGEAFAAASDKPELIEGCHADSVLYIFDESKAIIPETFDAAEGAFSGASAGSGLEALALAMSTPGEPSGRFYAIHCHAPGLQDWWTRHVTLDEAIAAGRVSREWADQRALQWGTASAVFVNRVLGEFHSSDEDSVVPLSWIEAANDRWRAWDEAGRPDLELPHVAGVDVARCFDDQTEILTNDGWKLFADVKGTEQVLTLDGDCSEWGPVTEVHKYRHDGHLNVYEARGASFAITDAHRLLCRSPKSSAWELRRFDQMPWASYVRRCASWSGTNPARITFRQAVPMPHGGTRDRSWTFDWLDFCEFLGWFVSEGCVYHENRRNGRARIVLSQNPGPKLDRMQALLVRMGFAVRRWSKSGGGDTLEVYCRPLAGWLDEHCGRMAHNKRVPRVVKDSATEAIERFLETYQAGDGCPTASGGCSYRTSSTGLADDLQEMLAKLGVCGKATLMARAGSKFRIGDRIATRLHDTWSVIRYSRPQDIYLDKNLVRRIPYGGFVYCVSTPLQTILVRRHGVVMWSGNSGLDKTIIAVRHDHVITELREFSREDTMETTGHIAGVLSADPEATAIVDVIGIGAGVVDRLREMKARVEPFTASARTSRRDISNEMGYANTRSAAWWNMREILDPSRDSVIALPPDDQLTGDLTAPHWRVMSGGKIMVESKDDIRKRIGRSTDRADAVISAFFVSGVSWLDAYGIIRCESCDRSFLRQDRTACPHCKAPVEEAA